MFRFVVLIALAGCGRVGFDAGARDGGAQMTPDDATTELPADVRSDSLPVGHDEDGDGVPDSADSCPHLLGPQLDSDGDGVGDACDPNPTVARDTIALFATMQSGDQPFSLDGDGVWTQLADSLAFTGDLGGDNNLYGALELPMTFGDVRVVVGVDITAVVPGPASMQHQFAVGAVGAAPLYFGELLAIAAQPPRAQITYFDGASFLPARTADLASGIHPGVVTFELTQVVGTSVRLDVGWPGEPYTVEVMDSLYQGGDSIVMTTNNLHYEIRYVLVITSS